MAKPRHQSSKKRSPIPAKPNYKIIALALTPILIAAFVWFSSLSFVPVPWPDDSAFYFVAKELFKWPPRWVMLPQAPFEPTYRIWNFNTMPLYPILIGLIRMIGLNGIWSIKILPLGFWAATSSLLGVALYRAGLPWILSWLIVLATASDPALRWYSVIVRPESLISLCAVAILLGFEFGFSKRVQPKKFWHPVSALMAVAAYAHFNAVHILFAVIPAIALQQPRQGFWRAFIKDLFKIGGLTALYLTPWMVTILFHPILFVHQMQLQWQRLAVGNDWLNSVSHAVKSLYQDMGIPERWPDELMIAAWIIAAGIIAALVGTMFLAFKAVKNAKERLPYSGLIPAGSYLLGTIWLWNSKPEVWFTGYIHQAFWVFIGLALLKFHTLKNSLKPMIWVPTLVCVLVFAEVNISQAERLGATQSWHWDVYQDFIGCIDEQLTRYERDIGTPRPFRVWAPTFPDITIELAKRHPDWDFSRTNDFWNRKDLAIQHGVDVEAVVIPEILRQEERTLSVPASERPEHKSVWMEWDGYFLIDLSRKPGWKPNRWICQRGRWEGFLYLNPVKPKAP